MITRLLAVSGTRVAVCDPPVTGTWATSCGFPKFVRSKTWMPSNPVGIVWPSHVRPAGAGVLYERTSRSGLSLFLPQMTMSPWFPLQG